jgi:hypothetical protein
VNQAGELISAVDATDSGPGGVTNPGSALRAGGNIGSITGDLATGVTGRDENLWKPVQD